MAGVSPGAFIGLFFLLVVALVLLSVGIFTLRLGRQSLEKQRRKDRNMVWHRHALFLFGINNIVFAFLPVFIIGIILFTDRTLRMICIALIVVALVVSFTLLGRLMLVSLRVANSYVVKKVPEEHESERESAE